jgi:serine/threonine protein phosphatase 1
LLGDIIDRGPNSIKCLEFVRTKPNVILLLGNHEQMLLDYFTKKDNVGWLLYGGAETLKEAKRVFGKDKVAEYWSMIVKWLMAVPLFAEVTVGGVDYFLSHAGLDATKPLEEQEPCDFLWNREEFFAYPALDGKHCVFGHTPTVQIRPCDSKDLSIWTDPQHKDKTAIDCGCVYGGALAALRLDDGKAFYVN